MKLNYNKNYCIKIKIKSFIKNNLISDFLILLKRVLNLNIKTKNDKNKIISILLIINNIDINKLDIFSILFILNNIDINKLDINKLKNYVN